MSVVEPRLLSGRRERGRFGRLPVKIEQAWNAVGRSASEPAFRCDAEIRRKPLGQIDPFPCRGQPAVLMHQSKIEFGGRRAQRSLSGS